MNNDLIIEKKLVTFKKFKAERDRLINTCKAMIEEYNIMIQQYEQEKKDEEISLLSEIKGVLAEVEMKDSKTQLSYKVPSGQIIIKKPEKTIKLNKTYYLDEIPELFIERKESVKWGELKKTLIINGDSIINQDGEIIDYCSIETKPEEYKIKL
jgi:hypothetical protein